MATGHVDVRELQERLAVVGITGLRPLAGGASSITYAGSISAAGGRRVVVKVAPAGMAPVLARDVLRQARLMRALATTAVPVPEIIWEEGGQPPAVPPLYVMAFVEGRAFEPLFDLDADHEGLDADHEENDVADAARHAARTLAALHSVDPDALGLGDEPLVGPAEEVERWCRLLETVPPELAPGWPEVAASLRQTAPAAQRAAIVHGDFRLGNLLTVGGRVAAVVDWEIWTIGDPRVDLGWFLLNADPTTYRRGTRYESSMPGADELLAIYEESLGHQQTDVRWFQALARFKSTATWSLIVKHNRRRASPDPTMEDMAGVLPHLLEGAASLLG